MITLPNLAVASDIGWESRSNNQIWQGDQLDTRKIWLLLLILGVVNKSNAG